MITYKTRSELIESMSSQLVIYMNQNFNDPKRVRGTIRMISDYVHQMCAIKKWTVPTYFVDDLNRIDRLMSLL